jgi:DNA ligase-associated metallophosphoesterase
MHDAPMVLDNPAPDCQPPGHGDHVFEWAGATHPLTLHLTPERAVHWPAEQTLFVADVHLGKAAVFRARGLPVPRGTTTSTLARLSQVLTRTGARRLIVLGDLLHARESHARGTMGALRTWRAAHPDLQCVVVQGNHDRHAGALAADLDFDVLDDAFIAPGLIGVHDAGDATAWLSQPGRESLLALAGHEHPVVTLRDRLDQLRMPCFALRGGVMTLPSFGDFTGGHEVTRGEARIFVAGHAVVPLQDPPGAAWQKLPQ